MQLTKLLPIPLILGQAVDLAAGIPASPPKPAALAPVTVAAAYPTTTTKISTTTKSSTTVIQFINPRVVTIFTIITATTLIPGPVTALPATVVETVISHITFEYRTSYSDSAPSTSVSTAVITVPSTWIVARPQATDLAAGTSADALPCDDNNNCATTKAQAAAAADPRCDALGLETGCQGQCEERDDDDGGAWWCYQLYVADYSEASLRMGRACWGGDDRYEQLNTPCVAGDHRVACTPCQGLDGSWGALNWTGPANNP